MTTHYQPFFSSFLIPLSVMQSMVAVISALTNPLLCYFHSSRFISSTFNNQVI
ncbi:MAG: hypothetical protein GY821_01320 [Gammaproteobacteria bacterium]|nr:hypothetical protein [Gammaproteobacteria bacterium]